MKFLVYNTASVGEIVNVDDVVETANHFRCIDMIIDKVDDKLTEWFIKELYLMLKNGTSDSHKDWFAVGAYKKLPNKVDGKKTTAPEEVAEQIASLLRHYNALEEKNV